MWELEPEETQPLPHASIDGCGETVHSECSGCVHESLAVDEFPCVRCWNGNGNGDWCYFERKQRGGADV